MTNVRSTTLLFEARPTETIRLAALADQARTLSKEEFRASHFTVPRRFGESSATRRSERDRIFPARGFRTAWISARTVAEPRQRRPNRKFQAYEDLLALATRLSPKWRDGLLLCSLSYECEWSSDDDDL
jgi:hypothetical protein